MKTSGIILGSMGLAMLMGYGAWSMYKKMNPECASKVKREMQKATRNLEKNIEDMM